MYSKKRVKVLIADDSKLTRKVLRGLLESDPEIKVIDEASNGLEAVKKTLELDPDVVIMDVVMPKMDGITAIKEILSRKQVPIIVFSSITHEGSKAALNALEAGALEVVPKPGGTPILMDVSEVGEELIRKVKVLASMGRIKLAVRYTYNQIMRTQSKSVRKVILSEPPLAVAIIASSTGGPQTLMRVIPKIALTRRSALLIIQHMPPLFTKALATKLNSISQYSIKEAEDGDEVLSSHGYVAPGGYHMRIRLENGKPVIRLDRGPKVHGVRPAADITIKDAAKIWGPQIVLAVLTGMGSDGAEGAAIIKSKGGYVIAQDEKTSVVWGMPREVVARGLADKVLPVDAIGTEISRILNLKIRRRIRG